MNDERMPDDLNAAIQLLAGLEGASLRRCKTPDWPGEWECSIPVRSEYITAYSDNPAEAIYSAWLAWQRAQP